MSHLKDLIRKLLHIDDTPERTALAFAIGIFLGFSPFLGFHTIVGLLIAFFFRLNRVAVLVGVWTNGPWWMVPYYTIAAWVGMHVTGLKIDWSALKNTSQACMIDGYLISLFRGCVTSQWGFFFSLGIGSLLLGTLLGFVAYPLSLKGIRFYQAHKKITKKISP